jgi:hypothetical protein
MPKVLPNSYLVKAKKLLNSGFFMAGNGNFCITIKELSQIIEFIEKNDFDSIRKLYLKLEEERL